MSSCVVVLSKCLSTAGLLSQSQLNQSPVSQHCLFPPPTTGTRGWALRGTPAGEREEDQEHDGATPWQTPSELKGCPFSRPPALLLTDSCVHPPPPPPPRDAYRYKRKKKVKVSNLSSVNRTQNGPNNCTSSYSYPISFRQL